MEVIMDIWRIFGFVLLKQFGGKKRSVKMFFSRVPSSLKQLKHEAFL